MIYSKGGVREEIRGTLVESKTIVFTEGDDDGVVNPDELVVGKKHKTGLKMSIIKFDLSELIESQQEEVTFLISCDYFFVFTPCLDIPYLFRYFCLFLYLALYYTATNRFTNRQH